jgi:hypothetical protein
VHSVKMPSGLQSSPKSGSGEPGRTRGSCPINRAAFVRQLPDRSRSPELSLIKGENTRLASRTPSRRAGTRALPVRGPSAA